MAHAGHQHARGPPLQRSAQQQVRRRSLSLLFLFQIVVEHVIFLVFFSSLDIVFFFFFSSSSLSPSSSSSSSSSSSFSSFFYPTSHTYILRPFLLMLHSISPVKLRSTTQVHRGTHLQAHARWIGHGPCDRRSVAHFLCPIALPALPCGGKEGKEKKESWESSKRIVGGN